MTFVRSMLDEKCSVNRLSFKILATQIFIRKEVNVNIYVGNISFSTTEEDLRQAFEAFGPVTSATILKDKLTNRSRGFGFVEMPDATNGAAAIAGLNGQQLGGRELNVSEARPRTESNDRDRGRSFSGSRDRRDSSR